MASAPFSHLHLLYHKTGNICNRLQKYIVFIFKDLSGIVQTRPLDRKFRKMLEAGQMMSAVLLRICCFAAGESGRALKSSRFCLMSGTPGPGQSVPNSVLGAISSRRGKYLSRVLGGMPLISR